ncbi:MAG TPA: IS1595 family transposase [Deltaproteobacteria bacterium]|nr:IS1595 family transposase [Deltaproteobacteria bacterium]HOI06341.1 IS1595 family transposase [Deltaproteobacteria bacterium]
MSRGNKYFYHSHISEKKFREIIRYFAMDLEASKIAELTGVSRNSVNKILKALRMRLVDCCVGESPFNKKGDEVDHFQGIRELHLKTMNDSGGKIPVFGVVNHRGKIYTQILPDFPRKTFQAAIRGNAPLDSITPAQGFTSYDSLVDLGYKKQYRLNNGNTLKKTQINCVDNFWGSTKMRLQKFRGMSKNTFFLHLKETEFRFNHRNEDLYSLLLEMLRKEPLNLTKIKESWPRQSKARQTMSITHIDRNVSLQKTGNLMP